MLGRLQPKKIIVVSSAPQIRYPDCYGIDMSKLGDFIAFRAAIELWKEKRKGTMFAGSLCKMQGNGRTGNLHTENIVQASV